MEQWQNKAVEKAEMKVKIRKSTKMNLSCFPFLIFVCAVKTSKVRHCNNTIFESMEFCIENCY